MRFKRGYFIGVLFIPLLILLTGCFQQAGDAFTPVGVDTQTINLPQSTATPLPPDNSSGQNVLPESSPTPTESENTTDSGNGQSSGQPTPPVAITIISPTREALASETPITEPTLDTGFIPVATATESQFVTPSSPLGPITPDTPVPVTSLPGQADTATPSGLITPTALPGADSSDGCSHTVQPGETLFRIAVKNGITVAELLNANPSVGNGDLIHPGDVLDIPGCSASGSTSSTGNNTVPATAAPPVAGQTYVVQRGDTLFAIAQRFGVTMKAIEDANQISNPNHLSVGQQLIIPASSG